MGAATVKLRRGTTTGGTAALPVQPDSHGFASGGLQSGQGRIAAAGGPSTPLKMAIVSVVGSASYATNGETVDFTNAGFDSVVGVFPMNLAGSVAASEFVPEYAYATGKLKILRCAVAGSPFSELPNATNAAGATFLFMVFGT